MSLKLSAAGCRYTATLTVSGRGAWKVTAAFPGNGSLKGPHRPGQEVPGRLNVLRSG